MKQPTEPLAPALASILSCALAAVVSASCSATAVPKTTPVPETTETLSAASASSTAPATPTPPPASPVSATGTPGTVPAPPDVAAPPADASRTASALASKVLTPGTGTEHPRPADTVSVHYTGWTTDGKMFDSSVVRGKPASFPVNRVIPGWTEGLQLMVVGEKRRIWIPEELAYRGRPGRPAGMLVFDVELLGITKAPEPPKTPDDVREAPADGQKTASGLVSKVLRPGTGIDHPSPQSSVTVHYSGWTTDGKMFDSSVARGQPATFRLDQVIAGWTEGVQLMVPGEKRRFWIPEALAYGGREGAPKGMLVFDVELISIEK